MKNKILAILILLISQLSFSQVGIGTTNPSTSSALEIKSTNSGLLIPRVSLNSTTDATTIASPATSLLVYNLSTSNDVTPGFYYWEGSWKPLKATGGSSSGWSLTGNNTAATDYLGTNNYNSLVFKVNNHTFSKFHPNGGITIGNSANANDNNSIAIGTSATSNTSTEAIAIGVSANASGYQSVSIGKQSLSSNNNTLALGYFSTASGQQATAIGANASASGQNATAIGYQATASQANSVILGKVVSGDEWSNPKIGIGTSAPDERLHIVGSVKIVDGTQGAGKVLTSDANGKATWASSSSNTKSYGDIYYNGSGQSLNQYAAVSFGSTNSFSNIVANTDNFQVLKTGKYRITYKITLSKTTAGPISVTYNLYNGYSNVISGSLASGTVDQNKPVTISGTVIKALTSYDQISIRSNESSSDINLVPNGCSLSIELID